MAVGVVNEVVAPMFVQYVKVSPEEDPAVMGAVVMSTAEGEQTAEGLVIATVGVGFELMTTCLMALQPDRLEPLI